MLGSDALRARLLQGLGISTSTSDMMSLWDAYLKAKGFTTGTIEDRQYAHALSVGMDLFTYTSGGFPTLGPELWPGFGTQSFANQRATTVWAANGTPTLNNFYLPTAGSVNFDYQCTTAGTNGASEPTWPTVAGQTVTSGTAVYTAVTKMVKQDSNGIYFTAANNLAAAFSGSIATVDGGTYQVAITVSGLTGGSVRVIVYGATLNHAGQGTSRSANGTYTENLTCNTSGSSTGQIRVQATGTSGTNTFNITSISVKRVS